MSESGDPPNDPMAERLRAYFDDVVPSDAPLSVQRASIADVRAAHAGGPARWFGSNGGQTPLGLVAIGVAAAVILTIIGGAILRDGTDSAQLDTTGHTEVPVSTTRAPSSQDPAATTTSIAGAVAPGSTDVTAPAGDPSTTTSTAGSSTGLPGNLPPTTAAGPNPTVPSNPGGVTTTTGPTIPPTTTTSTTAPPSCPILLCEDFADDVGGVTPVGWTVASGSWFFSVVGPKHYGKSNLSQGTESRLAAGSAAWTNYETTATWRYSAGAKIGGIGARFQDANNYLFCKLDPTVNRIYVGRFSGGSVAGTQQANVSIAPNTDYTLRMRVQGAQITCSLDGGPSVTMIDGTYLSGRVAIISDGPVAMTDIRVTAT
jgi:hypothetical protein